MEQVLQQGVFSSTHTAFSPKAKTSRSTDLAACSTQNFGLKPETKRSTGRPKSKCEGGIKINLT